MKHDRIVMWLWLSRMCLWTIGLILVVMPVHAFVSTWGGTAIGPLWLWKSWKELLLVVVAVMVAGWALSQADVRSYLVKQRLMVGLVVYAAIVLGSALLQQGSNGTQATLAAIAMDLRYLVAFAIAYLCMRFGTRVRKSVFDDGSRALVAVAALLAVLGILQTSVMPLDFLAQFGYDKTSTIAPYTLIDDNPELPRAFATLSGPNDYGAYLLLPLAICLLAAMRRSTRSAAGAAFAIGVGLYLSASRSAWLGAGVVVIAILALTVDRSQLNRRKVAVGIGGLVLAGAALLALALSQPSVRVQVFHSSPGDSSLVEGSTSAHWGATMDGVRRVIANPIGCGAGCAGPASFYGDTPRISENYYLQIAEQYGLIGLVIWLAIVAGVIRRLWQMRHDVLTAALLASFVGLSVIGLWLHVWADDPVSLTWWIVAGSVIGYNEHKWNASKNKSR